MPKIVDKEAKKLEILHAAMRVFARKGIVKTKMIDIAREAVVGKGTIYEYFRSKDEIFTSAYQFLFKMTEHGVYSALQSTDDPEKKLQLLIETFFNSFLHDGEEFAEIMMDFWAEGVRNKDADVMEIIDLKSIYTEYRKVISAILNEGISRGVFRQMDVHSMSSAFIGAFDGLMLQWIVDRGVIDIKRVSAVMLDGFFNGIKTEIKGGSK